jgi:hypothetical protein
VIDVFGVRLLAVPLAVVAFAVSVRRASALCWIAALAATAIFLLALVNVARVPAIPGFGYALVNAAETYLIVLGSLLLLALGWRGIRLLWAKVRDDVR